MSTAILLHMPKERFPNGSKRRVDPDDPHVATTFTCPSSYMADIERAAKIVNWPKGEFLSVSAHEYAKTVIAIKKANPEADYNELRDLAYATMRAHRKAFGKS